MKVLLIGLFFCVGCSWNVFQAKVPSAVIKSEQHLEHERVAGDYLARNVQQQNKQVANSLSHSLGHPKKSSDNKEKISEDLNQEIYQFRESQNQLNEKLNKYSGKEIEGTGIDIGKGISFTSIILLIVAVVAFPSLISILFYLMKQSRSALSAIVAGVEDFKKHDPQHGKDLKNFLNVSLDKKHKKLIQKMK